MKATHIPPKQNQREDFRFQIPDVPEFIAANSQCMGNTFQDLLWSYGMETDDKTLQMSTDAYYRNLWAFLVQEKKDAGSKKPIPREAFFVMANHQRFLNSIFDKNKMGVICECKVIQADANIIRNLIKKHKRPVGIGTQTTGPGGHWFIITEEENGILIGNDYFGTFPYKTEAQKKETGVSYSDSFLAQKGLRKYAVITGEGKKKKTEKGSEDGSKKE